MNSEHHTILHIITESYLGYIATFLGALLVHIKFPLEILAWLGLDIIGACLLALGTLLVVWSQGLRNHLYHHETDKACFEFEKGLYKVSRHPTYLGMVLTLVGFGLILNSYVVLAATVLFIVFLLTYIVPTEEKHLEHLCQGNYLRYKKKVRTWL